MKITRQQRQNSIEMIIFTHVRQLISFIFSAGLMFFFQVPIELLLTVLLMPLISLLNQILQPNEKYHIHAGGAVLKINLPGYQEHSSKEPVRYINIETNESFALTCLIKQMCREGGSPQKPTESDSGRLRQLHFLPIRLR